MEATMIASVNATAAAFAGTYGRLVLTTLAAGTNMSFPVLLCLPAADPRPMGAAWDEHRRWCCDLVHPQAATHSQQTDTDLVYKALIAWSRQRERDLTTQLTVKLGCCGHHGSHGSCLQPASRHTKSGLVALILGC